MQQELRQRTRHWQQRGKVVHRFYRLSGRYQTMRKYFWRLIWTLAVFSSLIYVVHTFLWDVETVTDYLMGHFSIKVLYLIFFLSESFLGLLPPDLYILWAKSLPDPYLAVSLLGLLSYAGGLLSWWEGRLLRTWPWLQRKVLLRYGLYLAEIKRYGSLLIVLAALTPLPFAPISIVAGLSDLSWRRYALAALARILRFFIYAALFFGLIA